MFEKEIIEVEKGCGEKYVDLNGYDICGQRYSDGTIALCVRCGLQKQTLLKAQEEVKRKVEEVFDLMFKTCRECKHIQLDKDCQECNYKLGRVNALKEVIQIFSDNQTYQLMRNKEHTKSNLSSEQIKSGYVGMPESNEVLVGENNQSDKSEVQDE